MREIINLQLGQCGNNIADSFLSRTILEHGINPQGQYIGQNDIQQERINVYFNEVADRTYSARNILVDLEPGTIDYIRGQKLGKLYNCDNFVVGLGSACNNWGVGYYGKGSQQIEILMDSVRREVESCDHLEGFQMFHSLNGGTGSGLGSLVLQRLSQEFEGRMCQTFSIFPSPNTQSNILESYNSVFSLAALKKQADMIHTLQNQCIQTICSQRQKITKPSFKNLNEIIALAASDITCGIRFPGQINSSLRKMAMNLVPFKGLKFLVSSVTPLENLDKFVPNTKQMLGTLLNKKSFLGHSQSQQKKYLTGSAIFRGKVCFHELQNFLLRYQGYSTYQRCVQFMPNLFQYSVCNYSPPDREVASTLVANNNCIKYTFQRMKDKYCRMFQRRAYVHWFVNQGVDEMEFMDMKTNLNNIIADYCWQFDQQQEHQYGQPQ